MVSENLEQLDKLKKLPRNDIKSKKYTPKFKLDYASGSTGAGVGTGVYGSRTSLAGGIDLLFGDILGNNQIYAGLALNGEIYDIGGVITYLNRKSKIAWGLSLSHIPYRTGYSSYQGLVSVPELGGAAFEVIEMDLLRIFEDGASVFAQLPLSRIQRFEVGLGTTYRYFRWDKYTNYYDAYTGYLQYQDREKQEIGDELLINGILLKQDFVHNFNMAFVGDNSFFGIASPMNGYRYRIGVEKYFGSYNFFSILADFRKYHFMKPVSIAFRAMHYGRHGKDENNFYPIFLGDMGMVHGYQYGQLNTIRSEYGISDNQLFGSKIAVTNFEVRLPLSGPERLSVFKSGFLFSELSFFIDGGLAWDNFNDFDKLGFDFGTPSEGNDPYSSNTPIALFSTGFGLRINLFGALVIEPYLAFPLQKNTRAVWGVNLVPGW